MNNAKGLGTIKQHNHNLVNKLLFVNVLKPTSFDKL